MTFRECIENKLLTGYDRYYGYYSSKGYTKCDSHLSGWYRFGGGAGTQMRTSCQGQPYYCNAYYPRYMSGGHPSVNDGRVSRTCTSITMVFVSILAIQFKLSTVLACTTCMN